ncbi:MAG: hypothetical protein ACK52I_02135 [Pseudomonadota bacterium]|jgi:hypothetical protein
MNSDHRMIFTSRRWWREPEMVGLVVIGAGLFLLIVWPTQREQPEPCTALYRQGHVTTQAAGTLVRDARGRIICEVVR